MTNPFDDVIEATRRRGYHNHRQAEHSTLLSEGILRDLRGRCPRIDEDLTSGNVRAWTDRHLPAPRGVRERGRLVDLLIGPAIAGTDRPSPDFRICIEHKSVITAHRNARARFGDLNEVLEVAHLGRPDAVLVATLLLGVSERYLNVADRIKSFVPGWEKSVLPALSTGDQTLWTRYPAAVSSNGPDDAAKTLAIFRELPLRDYRRTHLKGYDFRLAVPVDMDNVNPPRVARSNSLNIDVDAEYDAMIDTICRAYSARWPSRD